MSESTGSLKRKSKPVGTLEYQVVPGDTIEKIALKWNTIPSEIQHLNRLVTRTIFPGQTLYVPDPDYVPPPPPTSPPMSPPSKNQLPDSIINELNSLEPNSSSQSSSQHHNSQQQHQTQHQSGGFNIFKWRSNPAPKPGHVEQQKHSKSLSGPSNENVADDKRRSFASRQIGRASCRERV